MVDTDVLVVGGGLAGSATAIQLAERGHRVVVLERVGFPRDKLCGEGLMPAGVAELLRLGVAVEARPFRGIVYTVGGHTAVGNFPDGRFGLGVRRVRLDAALASRSVGAGVERIEGERVVEVGGWPGRMWARTSSRTWTARALVGADGMRSGVRRGLGLERRSRGRKRYGLRAHFRLGAGARSLERVEVHAGPGFELYLTPTGDRELNLALLLERDATAGLRGDLPGGLKRLLHRYPPIEALLDGAEPMSEPAICGPLRHESRGVVAEGALLVGDAAGFLDGITGEGMSLTLTSARLGAVVLDEGLRSGRLGKRALGRYGRQRSKAIRDRVWLTEGVLAGIRHRRLFAVFIGGLARYPGVFDRILRVSVGSDIPGAGRL